MIFTRDFWNPAVAEGLRVRHYVATTSLGLVLALVVSFWGTLGAIFVGKQTINWAQRIQQQRAAEHIHSGIIIPRKRVPIAPPTGGGRLPSSGGIDFRYFAGTNNQSSLLSCAAITFAKLLAYEYNRALHTHLRISPRQLYDIDTGGYRGADGNGTYTSISDYNAIAATSGVVSTNVLSYGPHQHPKSIAPWAVERVPTYAARGERIASHAQTLWYYSGAGAGAVKRTRELIAHHRAVGFGSKWFFNAENSAWTTGKMGLPVRGDWVEYDHTTVAVRYNDSIRMPDRTRGAFLISNSFGNLFGRDKFGNINRGHGGYAWISYAYFARYAAFGEVVDLGFGGSGGGKKQRPASNAPTYRSPIDPGPQTGGVIPSYVHGVVLHDTGVDVTNLMNYWGRYYGVSPVGLVATAITESGLNQYAPRCCIPGDTSYGLMQFTLETACAYGLCSNIEAGENTPSIIIPMAARYFANAQSQACIPFPYLYVAYNAGSGLGCGSSFYYQPTGTAYLNFQNFLVNWNVALRYYAGGSPAPNPVVKKIAQVFPQRLWCRAYRSWKIKGCPSAYWHRHLGTVPRFWAFTKGLSARVGGVGGHEVWHPKRRYMSQRFQRGYSIYSWPTHKGWRPKLSLKR